MIKINTAAFSNLPGSHYREDGTRRSRTRQGIIAFNVLLLGAVTVLGVCAAALVACMTSSNEREYTLWKGADLSVHEVQGFSRWVEVVPGTNWILQVATSLRLRPGTTRHSQFQHVFFVLGPSLNPGATVEASSTTRTLDFCGFTGREHEFMDRDATGHAAITVMGIPSSKVRVRLEGTLTYKQRATGGVATLHELSINEEALFLVRSPD